MSLLNNALSPIVLIGLCGLLFVLGVDHYSQKQTVAHIQQVEQRRAAAAAAHRSEQAADLKILNARVAAARAHAAKLAAAMEKAARVAALPGDPAEGKMIYMPCATCHGLQAEGKRVFNAPRLAGQEPWYVRSQLLKFKEGVRGTHPHDIYGMEMAMATTLIYNGEVLDNVVAYIASLDTDKVAERGRGNAAEGKEHYAVCIPCHGPNAQGIEKLKAPALSDQRAWYLQTQLKHFKYGLRGTNERDIEGRQMIPVMQTIEEEDIADLVAYIQSRNDL